MESEKCIKNAIKDVEEGSSIRKAASKWGVVWSTVQDKCSGRTKGMRCGPLPFITKAEEERLAIWLIERAKRGFGLTVAEFLDCVKKVLDKDNSFQGELTGTEMVPQFHGEKSLGLIKECPPSV